MAEQHKRIVTIGVASVEEINERVSRAARIKVFEGYRLSFISVELLWKTLTPKRWEILRAMTGQTAMSVREVARRVERDVKAVHGDVKVLRLNGVVKDTEDGKVVFPYDEIKVDFSVSAGTHIGQPNLGEAIRRAVKGAGKASRSERPASKPRARAA